MFALIAVFAPSIIGVTIIEYLIKDLSIKKLFYYYIFLIIVSAIFNNIIAYLIFNIDSNVLYYLNTLPIFFVKYCLVSVLFNILLAFCIVVIIKNISFKIEVTKNEKKRLVKKASKGSKKTVSK